MQIDNVVYNVVKYAKHTTNLSQTEADCNNENTCIKYWEQRDTGTFSLLFPDSAGLSWKSDMLPNATVKLVKKKMSL